MSDLTGYQCSQEPHPGVEFYGDGGCSECGFRPAPAKQPDARAEAERALKAHPDNLRERAWALEDALRALLAERPAPTPDDREALIAALDDSNNWYYTGSRTTFDPARAADALIAARWHR